jgi:hypothetical protein
LPSMNVTIDGLGQYILFQIFISLSLILLFWNWILVVKSSILGMFSDLQDSLYGKLS